MSRNINVNPAHYKVAGRERQGEDVLQSDQRHRYSLQQAGRGRREVPPWEATRHSFVSAQPEETPRRTRKRRVVKKRKAQKRTRTTKTAKKSVRRRATTASRKPRAAARKRVAARKRPKRR